MKTVLLLAALQAAGFTIGPDGEPRIREPDSATMATAYADAETRDLVRRARAHRGVIDASVFRYRATVRQRVSMGLRALRRDRLVYRRETASEVYWRRDGPSRVEVKGAREAVPIALKGVRVPDDLESWARDLVPEPGGDRIFVSPQGGGFAWHPLVENAESVYRYATGDTTIIRLPDGREIRLAELRVTPRYRDIRLVAGSFWIELDGHAIVQAVFRPSREFDLERDLPEIDPEDAGDIEDVPGLFKPIRFDVRYVTIDYGLWEMRWWMPRLVGIDGSVQMGPARFPVALEISYSDYVVEADPLGLPELPPLIRELAGDSTIRPRPYEYGIRLELAEEEELLTSPLLGESLYDPGPALISEREVAELARRLDALPAPPWEIDHPRATWPWQGPSELVRYNRVEGLSLGVRLDWDLARIRADLTGRYGFADEKASGELGADLPGLKRTWRVAGYHRLAAADPSVRPLALGNSLNALVLGRDDGSYFRATGAELVASPAPGETRYLLRLYAEHQAPVRRNTDFSFRHWTDSDHGFRPNLDAADADQVGVAATVGVDRGLDPNAPRWGAWLELMAETGTHTFVRPGLALRGSAPAPGPFMLAAELAAGTTLGRKDEAGAGDSPSPPQSWWFLGGPATVRGFDGAYRSGPDLLRGRLELGTDRPAVRLALFSDAGWAGTFPVEDTDRFLVSAGVGASFLDGLLRVDLARTLQPVRQWRLEAHVDALF